MADERYSSLSDGGGLEAADEFAVARSGASVRVTPIGVPVLVYRYTVAGSDKASIDTGVDTADAGSNDWTNGDLLEVFIYARTDEAIALSNLAITLNNDSGNNYDREVLFLANTTLGGNPSLAQAKWSHSVAGANCAAGVVGVDTLVFPNYAGSVLNKTGTSTENVPDTTAGNTLYEVNALGYRSTSAINRLKIAPQTAGKKLKIGSQLLIYKRLSS